MEKITIYCIDTDDNELYSEEFIGVWDFSDEDFIKHSVRQGLVWDIDEFQDAFNQDMVSDQWVMRIVKNYLVISE
jgi:hypothetical protein